jgi:glycolate oxidase
MPVTFNEDDLNQQPRVKCALDPTQILNPGKVFPTLHRCAELGRMHIHRGRCGFRTCHDFQWRLGSKM